jgi:hypothetical protein
VPGAHLKHALHCCLFVSAEGIIPATWVAEAILVFTTEVALWCAAHSAARTHAVLRAPYVPYKNTMLATKCQLARGFAFPLPTKHNFANLGRKEPHVRA